MNQKIQVHPIRGWDNHIQCWTVTWQGRELYSSFSRVHALNQARRFFYMKDFIHD